MYMQKFIRFYLDQVNPSFKIKERLTAKQMILYGLK
jgi:hypothetical protein